jgi:hypothetical protein
VDPASTEITQATTHKKLASAAFDNNCKHARSANLCQSGGPVVASGDGESYRDPAENNTKEEQMRI